MVCRNVSLPEFCNPCLFLPFFNLRNLLYFAIFSPSKMGVARVHSVKIREKA